MVACGAHDIRLWEEPIWALPLSARTSVTSSLVRCDPIPGHPARAGIPAHLWVFGSSQLSRTGSLALHGSIPTSSLCPPTPHPPLSFCSRSEVTGPLAGILNPLHFHD